MRDPLQAWPFNPETQSGFSRDPVPEVTDYLSYSRVKALSESPRHFWWRYVLKQKDKETPARRRGKIIHKCVLETEEFLNRMRVAPDPAEYLTTTKDELIALATERGCAGLFKKSARKEEILEAIVEFDPSLGERLFDWQLKLYKDQAPTDPLLDLSNEEAQMARHVIGSVQSHPKAMSLLEGMTPELNAYYRDPEFGVTWFARLDGLKITDKRVWVIEVKSARCAEYREFSREVYERAYHLQSYIYKRIVHGITGLTTTVAQIVLESGDPYCTEVYTPHATQDETAYWQLPRLLAKLDQSRKTGRYLAYSDGNVNELQLPAYGVYALEDEADRELPR